MAHYVDVAVVHIQRYLSRTPSLRGRRGASAALAAATSTEWVRACLGDRAAVNEEAGRVDGVLSLVVHRPDDRDAVLRDVLHRLREELPGAEFQAAWGDGESYLDAYAGPIARMRERGESLDDLPTGAEFPLAAPCEICHQDPAVDSRDLGPDDGVRNLCADCVMRHSRQARKLGRTAEEDLADAVGALERPENFDALAGLASSGNKEHLATVYADGNAVGRFFKDLPKVGGVDRHTIVAELAKQTREALCAATCAARRPSDGKLLCVVPHVLGGDDVLVSLPAERAWRFTERFLREFGERMERLVRERGVTDLRPPTMSAGVVFGRRNLPFDLAVEQAERLLRQAKRAGGGTVPYVAFADTVTGAASDDPVSLAELRRLTAELGALAGLPTASRYRLAEALDRGGEDAARTLAARLGHTGIVAPFLPNAQTGDGEPLRLGTALRIARWWR